MYATSRQPDPRCGGAHLVRRVSSLLEPGDPARCVRSSPRRRRQGACAQVRCKQSGKCTLVVLLLQALYEIGPGVTCPIGLRARLTRVNGARPVDPCPIGRPRAPIDRGKSPNASPVVPGGNRQACSPPSLASGARPVDPCPIDRGKPPNASPVVLGGNRQACSPLPCLWGTASRPVPD